MHIIVEILLVLLKTLYYWIEGIVTALIPASLAKQKDVTGEKVLITGAGSGLGRLLALRFAKLGSTLILWDVNTDGNEETARMVKELGARVYSYTCDLSQRNKVYDAAEKVKREVGDIDILVNNAGIVSGRTLLDCPDQLIEKTMEVNINAHFWTTKSFLPAMVTKNHGHVVTIASSAGSFGVSGLADYCASKHAAVGFEESVRMELARQNKTGVKSTVICPFYINTGMFDGVQSRFPSLLGILEADYAADKIMEAILTNQVMLYMPRFMYVALGVKSLLPVKAAMVVYNFFGTNNTMDNFKGRQKTE